MSKKRRNYVEQKFMIFLWIKLIKQLKTTLYFLIINEYFFIHIIKGKKGNAIKLINI